MTNLHPEVPQNHQVSVTYGDRFHSFRIAHGATLGELAVRVGGLDRLHHSAPLIIEVILERQACTTETPATGNSNAH